ncbi:MAG: hypothetical protein AAF170_14675, partial [Bacteroidota bacterium]
MRTSLLALALIAAPAFAATSAGPADAVPTVVAVDSAPSTTDAIARPAVRVVIITPTVVSASLELQTAEGKLVRSYKDRLLWSGESIVELDVDDIPAGKYY